MTLEWTRSLGLCNIHNTELEEIRTLYKNVEFARLSIKDDRGYIPIIVRFTFINSWDRWVTGYRIVSGCRCYTVSEALRHWGDKYLEWYTGPSETYAMYRRERSKAYVSGIREAMDELNIGDIDA